MQGAGVISPLMRVDVPAAPARWESTIVFEGMHCAACANTIEHALRTTPGVLEADVSAASHRGRVVWDEAATRPSAWMRSVERTGYRPLPAHDAFATARRQAETRKMLWRLGVAGLTPGKAVSPREPGEAANAETGKGEKLTGIAG